MIDVNLSILRIPFRQGRRLNPDQVVPFVVVGHSVKPDIEKLLIAIEPLTLTKIALLLHCLNNLFVILFHDFHGWIITEN